MTFDVEGKEKMSSLSGGLLQTFSSIATFRVGQSHYLVAFINTTITYYNMRRYQIVPAIKFHIAVIFSVEMAAKNRSCLA